MKLSSVEIDVDKESQGDWIESPEFPGVWAKVRSIRNPDFRRAYQQEMRKARRRYGNQPIPIEVEDRIMARLMVDHVIIDVTGLEDDQDKPIQYDRQTGLEWLGDPKYRPIADFLSWAASTVGESLDEEMEDDAKNSKPASGGKRSGADT